MIFSKIMGKDVWWSNYYTIYYDSNLFLHYLRVFMISIN